MEENVSEQVSMSQIYSPVNPNASASIARSPFKDISNTKLSKAFEKGWVSSRSADNSWSERTEVITKQCHENYIKFSQEVVDIIIDNAVKVHNEGERKLRENTRLRSSDSGSEYEDAVEEYFDEPQLTDQSTGHQDDTSGSRAVVSEDLKNDVSIESIDKEGKGALELLKSFEKLGVSSPNTCRASLERAQSRLSDKTYNPFSVRTSFGNEQNTSDFQSSFERESIMVDNDNTYKSQIQSNDIKDENEAVTSSLVTQFHSHDFPENKFPDVEKLSEDGIESVPPKSGFLNLTEIESQNVNENVEEVAAALLSKVAHVSTEDKSQVIKDNSEDNIDPLMTELHVEKISLVNELQVKDILEKISEDSYVQNSPTSKCVNNLENVADTLPKLCMESTPEIKHHLNDICNPIAEKITIHGEPGDKTPQDIVEHLKNNTNHFSAESTVQNSAANYHNEVKNLEEESNPCEIKSAVHNSPVSKSPSVKGNFECIADQSETVLALQNSAVIESLNTENDLEDAVRSFETKLAIQHSPDMKSQKISDSFSTKSGAQNSPVNKPLEVKNSLVENSNSSTLSVQNSLLSKTQVKDNFEDVEFSARKEPLQKLPEVKSQDVSDTLEDISDVSSNTVLNMTVSKSEDMKDKLVNIIDPYTANSAVHNSPEMKSGIVKNTLEDDPRAIMPIPLISEFENVKDESNDTIEFSAKNSAAQKPPEIKVTLEELTDPIEIKSSVQNSPLKLHDIKDDLENITFQNSEVNEFLKISEQSTEISAVQNFPVNRAQDEKDTLRDIHDPYTTKSTVQNSPISKSEELNDNLENTLYPSVSKSPLQITPVSKSEDKDKLEEISNPIALKSLHYSLVSKTQVEENDLEDIPDPFKTKSTVQNSPANKSEVVQNNLENLLDSNVTKSVLSKSEDKLENVVDHFAVKPSDYNSSVSTIQNENYNLENIDETFKAKSTVQNSPSNKFGEVNDNLENILDTKVNKSILSKAEDKLENIVDHIAVTSVSRVQVEKYNLENIDDPFATKSVVQNSPLNKLVEAKDNLESMLDTNVTKSNLSKSEDKLEIIVDHGAVESVCNSSESRVKDEKYNLENNNDPFKTASVQNSPVNKLEEVNDNLESMLNYNITKSTSEDKLENIVDNIAVTSVSRVQVEKYNLENIDDPFATKSVVQNSPLNKLVEARDNLESMLDTNVIKSNLSKSEDKLEIIVDQGAVKLVCNSSESRVQDEKYNLENIDDPFKTESVQNSPVNKLEEVNDNLESMLNYNIIKSTSEDKLENIVDNIEVISVNRFQDEKYNLENIDEPFTTKSIVQNSPVYKLKEVNDNLESTLDPCITKSNVLNTPASKSEAKDKLENMISPFATKSAVLNSPVSRAEVEKQNLGNISDPFTTKSLVQNSPVIKSQGKDDNLEIILDPCPTKSTVLSTHVNNSEDELENDIDSFASKSPVYNSPVRKAQDKNDLENIAHPFKTKSVVQNSPVIISGANDNLEMVEPRLARSAMPSTPVGKSKIKGQLEDINPFETKFVHNSPVNRAQYKKDNFEDIVDPFKTQSAVQNSPLNKPEGLNDNLEILLEPCLIKSAVPSIPEGQLENIDPCVAESVIHNSPLSTAQYEKENLEDIADPFKTKSAVQNSPVKKPEDLSDNLESILDPLINKSAVPSTPISKPQVKDKLENVIDSCSTKLVQNSAVSIVQDEKDNLRDISETFATKSVVQNSPVSKSEGDYDNLETVLDPCITTLPIKTEDDKLENIIDPFATKSAIQNSPVKIAHDEKDNLDEIADSLKANSTVQISPVNKSLEVIDDMKSISDTFAVKSVVNSPVSKSKDVNEIIEETSEPLALRSTVQNSAESEFQEAKVNTEEASDPFATKSFVQNSPCSKSQEITDNCENIADTITTKPAAHNSPLNQSDIVTCAKDDSLENDSSKENSLDNTIIFDSTVVQTIDSNQAKNESNIILSETKNRTESCETINDADLASCTRNKNLSTEDFSALSVSKDTIFDADELEQHDQRNTNVDGMRKSISSLEFDMIAKEALNLARDATPQPSKTRRRDEINKTLESIKLNNNFSFEEFANAKEFFSNEEELDVLERFGSNENGDNLARNSLFVKFDPLVSSTDNMDSRRGSALISFSPFKCENEESSHTSFLKLDSTVNESTIMGDTSIDDCNTTVLLKIEESTIPKMSTTSTATQTEVDVVAVAEKQSEIKRLEIMYQDKLLRGTREFEEKKEYFVNELCEKNAALTEMEEENNRMSLLVKHFKTLMEKLIAKKDSMEVEFQEQLKASNEKHQSEITALKQQMQRQQDESTTSEAAFFELVKKQDRLRQVSYTLKNNNFLLEERNKELEQTLAEKKAAFIKAVKELEEKIIEADDKHKEEINNLEKNMDRASFCLKRAEMKIISLTESCKKKDEEIGMLSSLLDDCSSKFGS